MDPKGVATYRLRTALLGGLVSFFKKKKKTHTRKKTPKNRKRPHLEPLKQKLPVAPGNAQVTHIM